MAEWQHIIIWVIPDKLSDSYDTQRQTKALQEQMQRKKYDVIRQDS